MRTRTTLFLVVFVTVLLMGGVLYAWSLGTPGQRVAPQATVSIDRGEAWLQKGGQGEWVPVAAETPVAAGDHIRTGDHAMAHVTFFDMETARLDENAELVVVDALLDPQTYGAQRVTIRVLAGRVWSRVMKFTDRESSYTAHMSDVVATVRGTAFVMNAADPKGWLVHVMDSAVDVQLGTNASTTQRITAGAEAWVPKMSASTTVFAPVRMERRVMNAQRTGDEWFVDNEQRDTAFVEEMRARRIQDIKKEVRVLPGSFLYPFKALGEHMHLALLASGEARRDLYVRFISERLSEDLLTSPHADRDGTMHQWLQKIEPPTTATEDTVRWCARARRILGDYRANARVLGMSATDGTVSLPSVLVPVDAAYQKNCSDSASGDVLAPASVVPTDAVTTGAAMNENRNTNAPTNVNGTVNTNTVPVIQTNTPVLNTNGAPILFPSTAPTNTNTQTNQNTNSVVPPTTTNQPPVTTQPAPTNTNAPTTRTVNTNTTTYLLQPSTLSFVTTNTVTVGGVVRAR